MGNILSIMRQAMRIVSQFVISVQWMSLILSNSHIVIRGFVPGFSDNSEPFSIRDRQTNDILIIVHNVRDSR